MIKDNLGAVSGLTLLLVIILGIIFLLVVLTVLGQFNENVCVICRWICSPLAKMINGIIPFFDPINCNACGVC
ncbi:MAG: hypothetical protein QXL09_00275 [Candidatus Aenigmatarchaeota archaeon]